MRLSSLAKLAAIPALLLLSLSATASGDNGYRPAESPRLMVNIVVSHLRYDQLARMYKNLDDRGIKRLIRGGAFYTSAHYNFMFTQDSPGVATLMSGTQPSQHGVIGDRWVNYTTNEIVSSVGDSGVIGVGCNENEGQYSPRKLVVSNISDELKRSHPDSKVVSISLNPETAVLAGGKNPDAVYWFDGRYGNMATSSYYTFYLPDWVDNFNKRPEKSDYAARLWHVSLPYEEYISKKASAIILDTTLKFSFNNIFRPRNKDFRRLSETPFGNNLLTDFAIETIKCDSLGLDSIPDMLTINYGAQKYIAEYYGSESTEFEDAFYKLDLEIVRLLDYLDKKIGKNNYAVMLCSDHGVSDMVDDGDGFGAGKFNAIQFKVLINSFLTARYGEGTWVNDYRNRQIYLNRRLIYEKKLSLADIQNEVATFSIQFGGIDKALTATTLSTNYYGHGVPMKMQNSFFPKHSGDVIINLLPGWIELENEDASWMSSSSGSPYEYDTHVPLLFYSPRIKPAVIHRPVDMISVAPTISRMLGISAPNACEGEILEMSEKGNE